MGGGEASCPVDDAIEPSQTMEEIVKIIQEARTEGPKGGSNFLGGSMDLDDFDADADIDDIETSSEFVCALWVPDRIVQAKPLL